MVKGSSHAFRNTLLPILPNATLHGACTLREDIGWLTEDKLVKTADVLDGTNRTRGNPQGHVGPKGITEQASLLNVGEHPRFGFHVGVAHLVLHNRTLAG